MRIMKIIALGSLWFASGLYAASTAACAGCHGQHFEKKAMGQSKIVKDMSQADIIKALEGYKDGTYGGGMKAIMKGQVANLSNADIKAMAAQMTSGAGVMTHKATEHAAAAAVAAATTVDLNAKCSDKTRISKEDLGNKKEVSESTLGLRKSNLYTESDATPSKTDYTRPAPGAAPRFERAFENAPPMIPHSVEGLLPIKVGNNACLGCHMPDVAKSMKATPIPKSHFASFRPDTKIGAKGEVIKEGKAIKNTSDLKTVVHKLDSLSNARFNCSQCHAPQSKGDTDVANTFKPAFTSDKSKGSSNLIDVINDGVK